MFGPTINRDSSPCFFCHEVFNFDREPLQLDTSKNILFGTNSMEGALFVGSVLPDIYPLREGHPKNVTLNDLVHKTGMMQFMVWLLAQPFFHNIDPSNPAEVRQRLVDLASDFMFVCPDKMLLDYWPKVKSDGRVYYYRLDYRASKSVWNREWVFGANHMDDLDFVFGWPLMEGYSQKYNDYDRYVAENVINMWSNFAKHGKLVRDVGSDVKYYQQVRQGPSGYLLINGTRISELEGFPTNLCELLDVKFFRWAGRKFSQMTAMKSVVQSARKIVTAPFQIVQEMVTIPQKLSRGIVHAFAG